MPETFPDEAPHAPSPDAAAIAAALRYLRSQAGQGVVRLGPEGLKKLTAADAGLAAIVAENARLLAVEKFERERITKIWALLDPAVPREIDGSPLSPEGRVRAVVEGGLVLKAERDVLAAQIENYEAALSACRASIRALLETECGYCRNQCAHAAVDTAQRYETVRAVARVLGHIEPHNCSAALAATAPTPEGP
jgi:hypothetical protein